jgi:hypothetical protein
MRTKKVAAKSETITNDSVPNTWIDHEVDGCNFKDVRLAKRFGKLLGMMSEGIGESVPYACQDWANTKAAYRFFSNDDVSEDQILAGHFQATGGRLAQANQKILMLHDTCEFSFQRDKDSKIGLLGRPSCGKDKDGRVKFITVRGILMHSSLAITLYGLPPWTGSHQVLDPQTVQRLRRLEKEDQPDPGAHRRKGELPLAGEPASVHGADRQPR